MSTQEPLEGDLPQRIEIFYELPPSSAGTYQYEREDGTVVHGDASGEWTVDGNGAVGDIVFFASPLELMRQRRRGLSETDESGD